jgi:hypothetical protein
MRVRRPDDNRSCSRDSKINNGSPEKLSKAVDVGPVVDKDNKNFAPILSFFLSSSNE